VVGGSLLFSGCKKSASNRTLNEQATAVAKDEKSEPDQDLKAESLNNLKQIAIAFHNYHDTYKTFPAAVQIGPKNVPHSWRITLLNFLGQSALYERYHLDEPWDSEHNKALLTEMPAVLRAPGAAADSSHTSYFGFTPSEPSDDSRNVPAPAVGGQEVSRIRDITDGTSNTILVVESKLDVPWTQPVDLPFDPNKPLPTMGGIHADGFLAAMCDASMTFIPDSYDRDELRNMIDRRDGNAVKSPAAIQKEHKEQQKMRKLATSNNPLDRGKVSLANLKNIALAMHNYHDAYKRLPAAVQIGPKEVPHSWRVTILPFIDQVKLYKRYHQDEPWDSPHNKTLLRDMPDVYRAPGTATTSTNSGYFGFTPTSQTEPNSSALPALAGTRPTRFSSITDGTSYSLMVVESKLEVPWTQPTDLPFDTEQPLPAMGGIHAKGFFAAMCDGRAIFFPDSFDQSDLMKIILCADGVPVELPGANR